MEEFLQNYEFDPNANSTTVVFLVRSNIRSLNISKHSYRLLNYFMFLQLLPFCKQIRLKYHTFKIRMRSVHTNLLFSKTNSH